MPLRSTLLALLFVLMLSACDSVTEQIFPDEVTVGGVTYAAIGDAQLRPDGNGLVVSNIGASGDDGVRVSTESRIQEADIRTSPVDIPSGGRWGLQLFGTANGTRTAMATVWNEAIDAERHVIEFDYAPALGVETVTLEYYLARQLVLRVPNVPLASTGARSSSARLATAGTSGDDPTSVHVVLVNGVYIVATDYGGDAPLQGCAGTLLALDFPDAPAELCTDYVQAVPERVEAFPEATSLEVRARTLERFTIQDGSVD